MLDANFWQDRAKSKKIVKEKKQLEGLINSYKDSINQMKDLDELNQLASEENNNNVKNEILQNIKELRLGIYFKDFKNLVWIIENFLKLLKILKNLTQL